MTPTGRSRSNWPAPRRRRMWAGSCRTSPSVNIAARSPQAKGRIERLWNTLPDRLVSELRLRGIRTVEAAQASLAEFITDFNQRFGKPPADRQAVWRRPPRDLALRLGCGYRRVVARDNTVRLGPRVVQLRGARSYARLTVDVRELLDGCQRPPHIEPPGSGKLSHPGSPIVSQAGPPILSHPGAAIGSHHPAERDRIPSSFSPPPEILAGAHQLQEVTSGGTEESGDRHPR